MPADPKPVAAIRDNDALARARLLATNRECAACGAPSWSIHHVIPRGERGDDVEENLVGLCGHGTARCHGAEHGNPYRVDKGCPYCFAPPDEFCTDPSGRRIRGDHAAREYERRDAEWVHRRIGEHIVKYRPDTIAYVEEKLGVDAGHAYLERRYHLLLPATRL